MASGKREFPRIIIRVSFKTMSILEVKNVTKLYNDINGIRNISFSIDKQGVYGFLGPNGAGKSTTMNIIAGCLASSEGTVEIGGFDIYDDPVQAKMLIGYLPEQPPLYMDRTPREYLNFVAEAKRVVKADRQSHIEDVMKMVGISKEADRLISHLSKGYKQRVGIAEALIGDPEIIILDEPTVGLDPAQIMEVRQLIRNLGKDHTVILSSHILQEVKAVCDQVIIISGGQLVAMDTPEKLESRYSGDSYIKLVTDGNKKDCESIVAGIDNATIQTIDVVDKKVHMTLGITDDIDKVTRNIFFGFADKKKVIYELSSEKADLEKVFLELTNKSPEESSKEAHS